MESQTITVPGPAGATLPIRVYSGGSGPDLLYVHGAGGIFDNDPFLGELTRHYRVVAPMLPGFDDSEGSEHLRSMLDFTLHMYDVWQTLALDRPLVVGHSMGGMIAAEMAAIAPREIHRLVLIAPAGLWLDSHPVTDIFTALPFELPALLFHDPEQHGGLLSSGGDLNDPEFLTDFMVGNARRLGTASKLLFPIPDRGLSTRAHRISAKTQIIWGQQDKLIDPVYAPKFTRLIPDSQLAMIDNAGHMVQYEQTAEVLNLVNALHNL